MNNGQMLNNETWPRIKMMLESKMAAYYIERNGFYEIIVPDGLCCTEMPSLHTFDSMYQEIGEYFNRRFIEDFEQNYKPSMKRSELSDPVEVLSNG